MTTKRIDIKKVGRLGGIELTDYIVQTTGILNEILERLEKLEKTIEDHQKWMAALDNAIQNINKK